VIVFHLEEVERTQNAGEPGRDFRANDFIGPGRAPGDENGAGDFSRGAGARPQRLPGVKAKGGGQGQSENAERGADGQPRRSAGDLGRDAAMTAAAAV
jgi:hypothetical protein